MKIEVWSDFSCPFCYIGSKLLETAMQKLPFQENIYVRLKSYALAPATETNAEGSLDELFAEQHNITIEETKVMQDSVKKQAAEVGLQLNFDRIQQAQTFDAHRLIKFAEKRNKERALSEEIFQAYFIDGMNISDHAELVERAVKVGLPKEKTAQFLQTRKYTNRVKEDEELADEMSVRSVPFFVFNEKYAIAGIQPVEVFLEVMTEVWEEEVNDPNPKFSVKNSTGTYCCDDDGCYDLE